jgi:branched-chain amino acid transport system substrate-binding protein
MPRVLKSLGKGSPIAIAAAVAIMVTLSACGSSSTGGGGNKNISIATLFAVSGTDAAAQVPAQFGVDLAVSQAHLPGGYKLSVVHENYEGASGVDTTIGATDAHSLVSNASVLAIVGPFNSGVARVTMPITNAAGLTMISPTNTNPGLTIEQYAAANGIVWAQLHPAGLPDAYFRTCGNDVVQGSVDAGVALAAPISAKTAFVVDDDTTYGVGLANYFTSTFTSHGGSVVGSPTHIMASQISNLSSLASTIIAAKPDVVFFGGVTSGGGGALKKALVSAGYTKPMVGGDGIADDPAFITTAGSAAGSTYGSVAAPDTSTLTTAADVAFKNAYTTFTAGQANNTLLPYSVMSYDVANIEITAITNVINSGKAVNRANVLAAVAAINYQGLTGDIHFDANGDNAGATVFSIYEVDPTTNAWVFKTQVNG